ncbi:MAG: Gfo/Idh/MocA family oxidoreductase [Propionibacteriaceae bacterium]|jgi:predicted dehydrogenase|nr:Gfo/Idh/MocA family oxidoreductase [Propionibacteriaceae bacterium]
MTDPRALRIALNGVTGRMGYTQHFTRSLLPIRAEGGVPLEDGSRRPVEFVLVGRNEAKLRQLAARHDVAEYTTDLDGVIADPRTDVVFDAALTGLRPAALTKAMRAGKAIYTEKPTAETVAAAIELAQIQRETGVTAGVVHDKLYLPGLVKLRRLVDEGFFGRLLSFRIDFGYWVFEGEVQPSQRPSWNYRREAGGSMVTDMYSHWNYVMEGIVGPVRDLYTQAVTHIPQRWDERGQPYQATADDAAYGIFTLQTPSGQAVTAQINSSWCVRVHRADLVTFQLDGTLGSAYATLHDCVAQPRAITPKAIWNPDQPNTIPFLEQWADVPANADLDNGFKTQWIEFLGDVVAGRPHRFDLLSAARGAQLADLALKSSATGRRLDVPEIVL